MGFWNNKYQQLIYNPESHFYYFKTKNNKNNMERLKLSCKNYYFTQKGNAVYCHIKVYNKFTNYKNEVTEIATCAPDEEFDLKTGQRLARSRAEKVAFAQFKGWLDHYYIPKRLDENDEIFELSDRMKQYIEHQENYIKTF